MNLSILLFFIIRWTTPIEGYDYFVYYKDSPGVFTNGFPSTGTVKIAVGTTNQAIIPSPPEGTMRYVVVTSAIIIGRTQTNPVIIESLPSDEFYYPFIEVKFSHLPVNGRFEIAEINENQISGWLGRWQVSDLVPIIEPEPWDGFGTSPFVAWKFRLPKNTPTKFITLKPIP